MILITGASGKTGEALVSALHPTGVRVRALVRRNSQVGPLHQLGAHDVPVGDLYQPDVVLAACRDVETVYHICPNMNPDEVMLAQNVVAACRAQGVSRLVYHSVLHPQTEEMPHHWHKLRVEEMLLQSGLDYTILQPAAYMQNILAGWQSIVQNGIYRVPYAVPTRLGMVDLADVAEAAARILTEPGHTGATYELCGREVLTQTEAAGILADVLGRPVRAEQIEVSEWKESARFAGLSDYAMTTLIKMFAYYERFGFWGNSRVLTMLLGRTPTTFRDFVARHRT